MLQAHEVRAMWKDLVAALYDANLRGDKVMAQRLSSACTRAVARFHQLTTEAQ